MLIGIETFMSVSGPEADHNGIGIWVGMPSVIVRVRTPRRYYPVPGCAHETANSKCFATIALA